VNGPTSGRSSAEWLTGGAGLDLDDPDAMTDAERTAFMDAFALTHGQDVPYGPMFFADEGRPGVVKRYRGLVRHLINADPSGDRSFYPIVVGEMVWYCRGGYTEGVRYTILQGQVHGDGTGLTRLQTLEWLSLAFWWIGARGMREIQKALVDYEWIVPERAIQMPPEWKADPAAFASGMDFSKPELSDEERNNLERWYLKYQSEIPEYARYLLRYRPAALKAWRNRFEHTLRTLPKQWVPFAMIHVNVQRGYAPGIREGIQLARGFGMTRDQVYWACGQGAILAGIEMLSLVNQAAGDVLDRWDEPPSRR
jgi:hypothetical protein